MMMEQTKDPAPQIQLEVVVQKRSASELTREVHALLGRPGERAYDSGQMLLEIREAQLYKELGYDTMEQYLDGEKIKRSTAYSNMKLAETFSRKDVAVGISKLRLLVQGSVANPAATLEQGWPVVLPNGKTVYRSITSIPYRELVDYVKQRKETKPASPLMEAATALAGAFTTDEVTETPSAA
ncbi:MAG: hypothetical protein K0S10_2497 [Rubrobacteraceae bacterium]|jgi:hypothetical protein|nr:hypothetical protein [Rubrobacteraceae bacterium]